MPFLLCRQLGPSGKECGWPPGQSMAPAHSQQGHGTSDPQPRGSRFSRRWEPSWGTQGFSAVRPEQRTQWSLFRFLAHGTVR